VNIVDVNAPLFERAGPGHWNDPDMLEVGVGAREGFPGLTPAETQAHLGMWALMAAPLIAGNDVRSSSADVDALLTNPRVVAIDQDPLGRQGHRVRADASAEVWVKPLANGDRAVGLLNRTASPARIGATLRELGIDRPGSHGIQDAWTGSRGVVHDSVSADVPGHGLALYRLSP
jgi:alpha-galactosidase